MRKTVKNAIKFVTVNDNVFQLLGDSRPPTGAPPLDPAGGLPPRLCNSKISLKNPLVLSVGLQLRMAVDEYVNGRPRKCNKRFFTFFLFLSRFFYVCNVFLFSQRFFFI